ncbi:alpha/beta hydrolase [Streptomyces sp. CA-210063]|uniref:alpha/beta hydrolase n=1 Tax=Streptomyces sp. CA-210063 TaxID=2801029 RepID=UPI00214B0E30|nr:alpha/beta hydrolase [Streptomyces sp. CA-210063]UUU28468.1 alpha/beta hydrolase [Streptomyces sp. CA-210063]
MSVFHPDLRSARFIPPIPARMPVVRLMRRTPKPKPAPHDVRIEELDVPGAEGAPAVRLRIYRPTALDAADAAPAPAMLWIHGGGFLLGSPAQDEASSIAFARALGMVVVAVRYRLAPEYPSPAAVEDAYAALTWLFENAARLGVDDERIAVGGASAGGGLAASLVLYAHDRGEIRPAFQLLVYPMLDDRTVTRRDHDTRNVRLWSPAQNRIGWTSYLGREPGSPDVSPYAAAARRQDLTGLPAAWIGVGTLDLFHDEDVEYARRLREAGVPCEFHVVDGAFHGFDALYRGARVSREFHAEQARALRAALSR